MVYREQPTSLHSQIIPVWDLDEGWPPYNTHFQPIHCILGYQDCVWVIASAYWQNTKGMSELFILLRQVTHPVQDHLGQIHFATETWALPNHCAFITWIVHLHHKGHILTFLLDIIKVPKVYSIHSTSKAAYSFSCLITYWRGFSSSCYERTFILSFSILSYLITDYLI